MMFVTDKRRPRALLTTDVLIGGRPQTVWTINIGSLEDLLDYVRRYGPMTIQRPASSDEPFRLVGADEGGAAITPADIEEI